MMLNWRSVSNLMFYIAYVTSRKIVVCTCIVFKFNSVYVVYGKSYMFSILMYFTEYVTCSQNASNPESWTCLCNAQQLNYSCRQRMI